MKVTDALTGTFDRIKPGRRVPAARKRAAKSEALSGGSAKIARSKLQEQRDELAREFVGLQWDLGGVAYEMAIRDHFRLDVLVKQAAKLQQVDSSLGQAERMLRLEQDGVAGTCPSCGGVQARGAVFCWQCGQELIPATPTTPGEAPTAQLRPAPPLQPETNTATETLVAADSPPPTPAELEAESAPAQSAREPQSSPLSADHAAPAETVPTPEQRDREGLPQ